jgi:hypothetical protein
MVTHGSTLRKASGLAPAVHTVTQGQLQACRALQPRRQWRVETKWGAGPR